MKYLCTLLLPSVLLTLPLAASADPWKDESGHGHRHQEYKEEYWDGNCKVKRKLDKNGEYKEKRKCKGHEEPAAVYVVPAPPAVVEPGITIQGTVRIPQ